MTDILHSRRRFLTTSATAAAAALMPGGVLRAALAAAPAGNSLSAVKHVVIFMQENRSFDHYFGALQGVRGFNDRTALLLRNGNSVFKQPSGSSYELPFHLDTSITSAQCVSDLDHSWGTTHSAWDNAKFDNWVPAKTALTMGYYTRNDLPFHYALADAFTICDNYFCSVMGPTNPNRLYLWSGMIDPNATGGGPVTTDNEPGFSWTTYPERLQSAGVSWKVYQNASDNFDDNALAWFTQYRNAKAGSALYNNAMASVPAATGNTVQDIAAAIKNDVLNGALPQVSWVIAPASASEHPNNAPADGADMVNRVLEALTANQSVWASTVMFVDFDEHGGYFDHVVPPVPPAGTANEFVSGVPIGMGPRVPMTVVSPWSRGGYVNSQVFDHTSVLRFLETWTGVQEPNISAWRRQVAGDLTSTLNFSATTVTVPNMPDTASLAAQAASQCASLPAPTAPGTQTMPVQEGGTRPACALPYQPNGTSSVDKTNGLFWITMANTGTAGVHHSIYANNYRSDGPWQYDVPANGSVKDYFHVQTYGGGAYDLSLYGPNGFLRRFVGNINAAGGLLEVTSSYSFATAGKAQLILTMTNSSTASVTFTVKSNGYRSDGPWTYTVAAGATVSDFWNVQLYTNGWYDFTATASSDASFSRRFAGHVELGVASVTG
jgi:phospholipase C